MVSIKYLLEKRRGAGFGGGGRSSGGSRGGSSGGSRGSSGTGSRGGGSGSSGSTGGSSGGTRGGSGSSGSSSGGTRNGGVGGSGQGISRTGTWGSQSTLSSGPSSYGSRSTFSIPASQPFAGRLVGGGLRSGISSRGRYGSGFPFLAGAGIGGLGYYGVAGLGFPYGYWPLYYHPHYYGDDEYGPHSNSSRPGGVLVAASFSPPSLAASDPPQYMVYGDADSVSNVTEALTADCAATIVVPSTRLNDDGGYDASVNTTLLPPITPTNVQTYYRSSSFALYSFFEGQQNDSQALVNYTEPAVSSPVFYYPQDQLNQTFADCVNQTISTWLPIQAAASSSSSSGSTSTSAASPSLGASTRTGGVALIMGMLLLSGLRWQFLFCIVIFLCCLLSL
ncbi:uncharacterized protein JCM15063_004627 [Sporobolomyces koalae]|uniref:uncharacterized protein n=1 Tax=Sporobolomyces koalae TaxID=500713 RepID=UPI003170F414